MDKLAFIRRVSEENRASEAKDRVLWSRHALTKLILERLERDEVEAALGSCGLIEDYPTVGRPLPDCLVLGFVGGAPVHITVALDEDNDRVLVVTVYVPSEERWEDDWRTRK